MSDISELRQLLSSLAQSQGFQLDDRTSRSTLEFLASYLARVSYGEPPNLDMDAWNRIFFMGKTPAQLAEIALDPAAADGTLWPQQAFLLAFLKLLETPRDLLNYLPDAHRQLYYRELLGLSESPAQPSQVALSFQLAPQTAELLIPAGTVFSGGQDVRGTPLHFASDASVLVNHGRWTDLRWCTRAREGAAAKACIVYDESAGVPWPAQGLRLFDPAQQGADLQAGYVLASAQLDVSPEQSNSFGVMLATAVAGGTVRSARISAGDRWLTLVIKTNPGNAMYQLFELPADAGRPAAPVGLDGITLDVPVLQLNCASGVVLPAVHELRVNNQTKVPHTLHVPTPFGLSERPQPVAQDQLYLGFAGLRPGQSLSLYFNLQGPKPLNPRWEYLNRSNEWASLEATVVDGTAGLFRGGMWSAVLPADASDAVPAMPAGQHWVRARLDGTPAPSPLVASDYPFLLGIAANATTATLLNAAAVDDASLRQPLPADSIRQPLNAMAGLVKTLQPWPSAGGWTKESAQHFQQRAALRLSHRQRALTWKDMASILKSDFSAVFDVATQARERQTTLPAQPQQRLIVIALNTEKDNADPRRPMLNPARLAEMAAYLQRLASPWQDIVVANPAYRDVEVAMEVRFRPGVNPDYGYRQLREALERHYMPWAGDAPAGVTLASRLDYYDVIAQVQAQPEVECVLALTLAGKAQSVQGRDDEVLVLVWPAASGASKEEPVNE